MGDSTSLDRQSKLLKRIEKSKKLKIGIVVIGEMGHITPLIRLADALEEAGHETVFFTSLYAKEKAQRMMDQNGVKGKLITPDKHETRNSFLFGKEKPD